MHNNHVDNLLKVEIITPESLFNFYDVHMVTLPGSEGEFGVLPAHMALVSSLETGVITVHGNHSKILGRFSITTGFAEITSKSVVILAESIQEQG